MRWSIVAGLGVLLAGIGGCTRAGDPVDASSTATAKPTRSDNVIKFDPASPQLERIRVAPATAAVLPVDELEIPGKVEAIPARLARLALPAPGRVRQVAVTLGDRVQRGQVLLTVETAEISGAAGGASSGAGGCHTPAGGARQGRSRREPRARPSRQPRNGAKGRPHGGDRAGSRERRVGAGARHRG